MAFNGDTVSVYHVHVIYSRLTFNDLGMAIAYARRKRRAGVDAASIRIRRIRRN